MTQPINTTNEKILVAMDIAKLRNDVLVELPSGKQKRLKVTNQKKSYEEFVTYLQSLKLPCIIAFEATGNYHRPIAYYLQTHGFELKLISSIASSKTREALYNSWDKNDPKDTKVLLHLLKTGVTHIYHDPLIHAYNDLQELSKTHDQVSLRKVRIQHALFSHYLPLYFPEAQRYFHASRALWFSSLLLKFPCPSTITHYTQEAFIEAAWAVSGRKVNKRNWLIDFYKTAQTSIGIPISQDSEACKMFRLILQEHIDLCKLRETIELESVQYLDTNTDYQRLRTIPGIGPILALNILAEAGDLRRFKHHRQFLKFCGFDLSTQQSGTFRGISKLSKRGNVHLRRTFWLAGTIALRMRENTFRRKFEEYIKEDPKNADLKRKGYTAVAVKMARVAYSLIKTQTDYRCFFETT